MAMYNNELNLTDHELVSIVLISKMSDSIFNKKTVKEVIDILKAGFIVTDKQKVYVTVYGAVKASGGLYTRWEIENLVRKGFAKQNDKGEVYLPDILFYSFLRSKQKTLVAHGILENPKKDVRNYETYTEQEAEQLFIVFSNFLKGLTPEKRKEILSL